MEKESNKSNESDAHEIQSISDSMETKIEYRYIEKEEHPNVGGVVGFVLSVVGVIVAVVSIGTISGGGGYEKYAKNDNGLIISILLLVLGFFISLIGFFFKTKTLAASGVAISLLAFMLMVIFLVLYEKLDYITNYINDLQRIPLFIPYGNC